MSFDVLNDDFDFVDFIYGILVIIFLICINASTFFFPLIHFSLSDPPLEGHPYPEVIQILI